MKCVIVIEDIEPGADNADSNLDIKFMKMARPEELDDAITPSVVLTSYLELAVKNYLNGTGRLTAVNPNIAAVSRYLH